MKEPPNEGGLILRCTVCGPKPVAEFHKCSTNRRGYQYLCNECNLVVAKKRRVVKRQAKNLAKKDNRPIIAIGDTHFPFHHEGWYAWMLEVVAQHRPSMVIQLGDLYDQFGFSKYPRSHNVMLPEDEIAEGRAIAEQMWKDVKAATPDDTECVQLRGNHDDRIERRVLEFLPEIESLVIPTVNALFAFEGVRTINESREEFVHRGIFFHHGHRTRFGSHMDYNNHPTVNGHLHKGGVLFKQTLNGTIWELNAGCGVNPASPIYTYGAQKRLHGVTLGLGCIDIFGPRFMPYQENR